jgi:hypothetical protein
MKTISLQERYDYSLEIAQFLYGNRTEIPTDWYTIMTAYQKLCDKIPFTFVSIEGKVIYYDFWKEVEMPFQDAFLYVVGDMCLKYNQKVFDIKYE